MPSATQLDPVSSISKHMEKLPRLVPRQRSEHPQNLQPTLEVPPLPALPDLDITSFTIPRRRVLTSKDLDSFQCSPAKSLILSFVFSLANAVADRKISSLTANVASPTIHIMLTVLSSIEEIIASCPPADQGQSRFGNPSFRFFLDRLDAQSDTWHRSLGLSSPAAVAEVSTYLCQSFGNRTRIDYGSGHELNFISWLLCLNRLSLLPESDFSATTLVVFPRYVRLMRKLQSTYYLEPAGSHGVWGLDDYHFLPFLFGASQLLHHPYIRPLSIHNEITLEEEGDEYLYLDMIRWTTASKSVKGLKWTQPMLDDISGAKSWEKVEQGMRKLFVKEVLGKLPVMQHFLFGSLISAPENLIREGKAGLALEQDEREEGEPEINSDGVRHVHRGDAWGDCCGIKIPSTVAAVEEERKDSRTHKLRGVPFD